MGKNKNDDNDDRGGFSRRKNGHSTPQDTSRDFSDSAMFDMTAQEMMEEGNGYDSDEN